MSDFQFNPEERNFPIYGSAERSYPIKEPIDYRLWVGRTGFMLIQSEKGNDSE